MGLMQGTGCKPQPDLDLPGQVLFWTVVETVRIGSVAGEPYPLRSINRVLPGPDGSVLVSQQSATEIPQFDRDGGLLRVFGRAGDGPGEFSDIADVGWLGDTLWVTAMGHRKIAYFSSDGRHLDDQAVEFELIPSRPYLYPWTPRLLAGGDGVMIPGLAQERHDDMAWPIYRTDRAGRVVDTLSLWPIERTLVWVQRDDRGTFVPRPFPVRRHVALSPSGQWFAMIENSPRERDEQTVSAELRVWNAHFEVVLRRELFAPAVVVPEAEVATAFAAAAERASRDAQEQARVLRELRAAVEDRIVYDLADDLVISDGGEIWIRLGRGASAPASYWIVNQAGEVAAAVTMPEGVDVAALSDSRVWAVFEDDLDVPYLIQYSVIEATDHGFSPGS